MTIGNVKNLEKFFATKIDSIDFNGKDCIQEFLKWYYKNDVRLLLRPYINPRENNLNAIFIPLKGVKRKVFHEKNSDAKKSEGKKSEEKLRQKVEKWKEGHRKEKLCIHDEWYSSFPSIDSSSTQYLIATIFYE